MKQLYKNAFDHISMAEDVSQAMGRDLVLRCSRTETEDHTMKKKAFLRRPLVLAAAILLVCALSVTAFAQNSRITQLLCGAVIETVQDERGNNQSSVTWDMENSICPVEVRSDGQVYFILNGEMRNVTGEFSYEQPFLYEYTDEMSQRHVFILGGEADAVGWAEYIWDASGMMLGGSASFPTPAGPDEAPWFHVAMERLDLPL